MSLKAQDTVTLFEEVLFYFIFLFGYCRAWRDRSCCISLFCLNPRLVYLSLGFHMLLQHKDGGHTCDVLHSLGQIVSIVGEFWGQNTLSVYIFSWFGGLSTR